MIHRNHLLDKYYISMKFFYQRKNLPYQLKSGQCKKIKIIIITTIKITKIEIVRISEIKIISTKIKKYIYKFN